jgi:hypothetical protein
MIRRTWIVRLFAAAVVAVGVSATPAKAGLVPITVSIQPEAGNFRWTYSIVLPSDYKLQSGDYFTIYDFEGYVAGSESVAFTAPDGATWSFSTNNVGPTPGLLNPNDDPTAPNLTWTYSGPTVPKGQLGLGNFAATSLFGDSKTSHFTATNPSVDTGEIDENVTRTVSPTGEIVPPPPGVPEPTTLALAGLGLPIIGAARWYRRKKQG